jgi:hypothetical protein
VFLSWAARTSRRHGDEVGGLAEQIPAALSSRNGSSMDITTESRGGGLHFVQRIGMQQ